MVEPSAGPALAVPGLISCYVRPVPAQWGNSRPFPGQFPPNLPRCVNGNPHISKYETGFFWLTAVLHRSTIHALLAICERLSAHGAGVCQVRLRHLQIPVVMFHAYR